MVQDYDLDDFFREQFITEGNEGNEDWRDADFQMLLR
jgi:hypothetical protein